MTDKNGKPLKVGDKVTHKDAPAGYVGTIVSVRSDGKYADVEWPDSQIPNVPRTAYLTLVEPAVEHTGTNVFEALERPNAAELFAKAELVSRVRDIMDGFERSRFPQVADEILKAVAAYHE